MKKILFTAWLLMLAMMTTAQTFTVVDQNGKAINYDVSKLQKITFQTNPAGFTVFDNSEKVKPTDNNSEQGGGNQGSGGSEDPTPPAPTETKFEFDNVQTVSANPKYLFTHPDTVFVSGETESFTFQVNTNVEYTYNPTATWIKYSGVVSGSDSLRFVATNNPAFDKREAMIIFICNDDNTIRDTVYVKQAAKTESHYIDIDWTTTTLDSFEGDEVTMTFTGEVPEMGELDVVLVPSDGASVIRLIEENGVATSNGGKTVTLTTREGKMGNLFKGAHFKLDTDVPKASISNSNRAAAVDDGIPVYRPAKIEIFNGYENVVIYDANKPETRSNRAPVTAENEFLKKEFNDDGHVLWDGGNLGTLSWQKLNFDLGLKGLFEFDFGEKDFENVKMGDLKNLKMALEGSFNTELILEYTASLAASYEKTIDLVKNVIPTVTYTFMIGTVPLPISVGADLKANIDLGAEGTVSVTAGAKASASVKVGVEWDEKDGVSKIAECEKNIELIGPTLDAKAEAHAKASAYPEIKISIYKVLCPTISPAPYINAEAHAQKVENLVAWDAGISTGVDLGLGLSLDLFFWDWELFDIEPINVFDLPLVSLPDAIELTSESPKQMLKNNLAEVKYHVTNKNYITGTEYNAPGVLVKFEAEGGELQDEYGYTDTEGNVSAFFTLTDDVKGGKVKAEVIVPTDGDDDEGGDEGGEGDDEEGIKADDWEAEGIQYRLQAEPAKQTIAEGAESATITFKLEQYSSKTTTWTGVAGKTIYFEATGGSCNASGVTTNEGIATATFTPKEEDFTEGSVTATITLSEPGAWSGIATGNIYAEGYEPEEGVITDEGLKKAVKQKENVYVIENKKTGETQERSYVTKWSEWNKDQDNISFSLEDADADGGTLGMIYGFIPRSMTDVVLALTGATFENSPGAKFGFGVYEGTQLSADFAKFSGEDAFGNLKPESKIMLRKISNQSANSPRRAPDGEEYTGDYELLFYLVFKNQTYNHETQQMEEGDDYEVYGRGTMKMHIPSITSFQITTEKDWVKVGESTKVTLEQYYEEGATWDWNDVEILGQSADYTDARNGVDEGFFSWDAATQTLTSLKSNDNKSVNVCLALKSNPGVKSTIQVKTGEGWNYTMIKPSQEELTYTGYGYMSFSFDWTPKASEDEKFDFNSIEIDPETNPNGYFSIPLSYASQGWPLYVNSDTPAGEYNVRIRIKSNHDLYCTVKIIAYPENE